MAPEDHRRRHSLLGGLPWLVAALGLLALGAIRLLWPFLHVVGTLAIDAVLFAILGTVAYCYLRRLRRRKRQAAEAKAVAAEQELPPPAEQPEEVAPPEEESLPPPVPERDRVAEVEARLQAIKRRLGKG